MMTWSHAVRKACCKLPEDRTQEDVSQIQKFVKDSSHLFENLEELEQKAICEAMSLEEFQKNEMVFDFGEVGDKFYIVLEGHLQILVPQGPCPSGAHEGPCNCDDRPWETIVTLERGMSFGELALLSDQPRSARVATTERSELLVTLRSTYNQYVGEQHRRFIKERTSFMRQCKCFNEALKQGIVTLKDLGGMAQCLRERQLMGQTVVCRQGEAAENIIFVRSGRLLKLRAVDEACVERQALEAAPTRSASSSPRKSLRRQSALLGGASSDDSQDSEEDLDSAEEQAEGSKRPQRILKAKSMMEMKKRERKKMQERLDFRIEDDDEEDVRQIFSEDSRSVIEPPPQSDTRSTSKERVKFASPQRSPGRGRGSNQPQPTVHARKHLLCVGKVDPYEYIGDQFLVSDQAWPVSLVSDAVAEVYVLSKYDVLKRISNKVFNAIFSMDGVQDVLPSDRQLLEMNRQTERWEAYRKVAHLEAAHGHSKPSQPAKNCSAQSSPRKPRARARLTVRDTEHFGDATAVTMRRLSTLQNDRALQNAFKRSGRLGRERALGEHGGGLDPHDYRLEQHWLRVAREDPIMLALDDALDQVKDPTLTLHRASGLAPLVFDPAGATANSARGGAARQSARLPTLVRGGTAVLDAAAKDREQAPLVLPLIG